MILLIHKLMDGEKHVPEGLPRSLKNKIGYLRAAFKRLGVSDDDMPRYTAFLDDVKSESTIRHDIIHGFPVHHPSDEGEAKMIRLLIKADGWDQRPITITIASVTEAATRAKVLADKAEGWCKFMFDAYLDHVEQSRQRDEQ